MEKLREVLLELKVPKLNFFFSRVEVFQIHTENSRNRKKTFHRTPLYIIWFMSPGCKIFNNSNNINNHKIQAKKKYN